VASHYEQIRAGYINERPIYKQLCEKGAELLRAGLRAAGIRSEVDGRAKDLVSYLRKMLRRPEYLNGERPIQDKAGLRVVLPYFDDEREVQKVIECIFDVDDREETVVRLGADQLGYLAVHYIVRIRPEHLDEEEASLFKGRQAEIQVGSIAQRAWAEVSHELLYKGAVDIPVEYQRIINRLVALMEVFDSEVERAREAIATVPGFEFAPLISALDRELLRFTSKTPDRSLSQLMVPPLGKLYGSDPASVFDADLAPWMQAQRPRLADLYSNYETEMEKDPLFCQPEAFLIFERAENDPTGLKNAWPDEIPRELLVSLTELWGDPVT
jgi:ppGpp synthetase/RelA/SpoT-type nucleotidyltranferase